MGTPWAVAVGPEPAGPRPLPTPRRRWPVVLAGGVAGLAAIGLAYGAWASRLPARVPSHYGADGTPDAWLATAAFVAVGLATEAAVMAVFVLVQYFLDRSGVLEHQLGPRFGGLGVAVLGLAVVDGVVPPIWVGLLASDAGVWSPTLAHLGPAATLVLVVLLPVGAILVAVVLGLAYTTRPAVLPWPPSGAAPARRGARFECSSCGMEFVQESLSPFTPRVGIGSVPGRASYYYRCPRCGERGWQKYLGRAG